MDETVHVCSVCGEPIDPGFYYIDLPLTTGRVIVCEMCLDDFLEEYAHEEAE